MDKRKCLKVKIKSLAAEARIIKDEIKKTKDAGLKWSLHEHNVLVVRHEARHTLLAYGFLRGRAYEQLENKCKHQVPNWDKVRKMVVKYGRVLYRERDFNSFAEYNKAQDAVLPAFEKWIKEADQHIERQRKEDKSVA
jgi:hypothetical protein